ncbi:MAG: beta-N-acetylhexosaminidase [Dehalococcoidia bacterium]
MSLIRRPSSALLVLTLIALLFVPIAGGVGRPPQTATATSAGQAMSLEVKIGQMLMAGVAGRTLSDDARHMIADLHVGNVVLMGPNIDSPAQVLALTRDLQRLALESNGAGLLIGTDQEGGLVQRLRGIDGFTLLPDAATVGRAQDPDLLRRYGRMMAEEMRAVGVTVDFAPVIDVNDNPANPVIGGLGRSFGATPARVASATLPVIAGFHDAGIAATGKHFPGHGSTAADSHLAVPVVTKSKAELDATELAPFRAAIAAGIDAIMTAHVVYPALDPSGLPATVSKPIITGILRDELGFDGVIFTDDMGMAGIAEIFSPEEAAVQAVLAGADIVVCARLDLQGVEGACRPEWLERLRNGLLEAARDGRLPLTRIDESVARIQSLKQRYSATPASGEGLSRVQGADHLRIVADVLEAAGRP